MKNKVALTMLSAMIVGSVPLATPVFAQDSRYGSRYERNHHTYRGHDRDYRRRCGGGNGAVGTIGGGVGGAVLGSALGGGALGTIAGGVGGALVGRHFDKTHTRHRNGC